VSAVTDILNYTLENKIALVHMDDGKANALSDAMIAALLGAVDRAEKEASAMILLGRPGRFCAGFDLKVMMSGIDAATALLTRGSEILLRLFDAKVPLVIACSGHALAGGALVVLTGDTRIGATGDFRIGLNEVSIGMPVPVLAMELARSRLLPTELTKATLQARIYGPDDAVRAGYLDAAVSADDLLPRAKEEAARLAGLSNAAYRATKTRLRGEAIQYIRAKFEEDVKNLLSLGGS
jgi:enoyl-CoA hydratase